MRSTEGGRRRKGRKRYVKKEREKEGQIFFYLMSIRVMFRNLPLYKS
jgi:hypothetical protein